MTLLAQNPTSVAKILDISFTLFKACFSQVIGLSLIVSFLSTAVSWFLSDIFQEVEQNNIASSLSSVAMVLAIVLIISIFTVSLYNAMVYRIDNIVHDNNDSFTEVWGMGFKKTPRVLWAFTLYYLAVTIGFIIIVIPGIILTLSLSLFGYYILLEDKTAYQSLKACHTLVWKDWWRTIAVFTVPTILIVIFFSVIGFATAFFGLYDENWIDIGLNLLSALYMPYFLILGYVQYHDLKLRKSGTDLIDRLNE